MHQALRDAVAAPPVPQSTDRRSVRTRRALRQALAEEIDATGALTRVTATAVTERAAGPRGRAPTASTTATLAMGDAIAMALMSVRNFTSQAFALFHPGGALGRRLLLKVSNVMHTGDENPIVKADTSAKDALFTMTDKGLGAASVVDEQGKFIGLVTDGIIRRALAKDYSFLDEPVKNIMFTTPLTISSDKLAAEALSVMDKHKPRPVTVLPVVDGDREPVGIVHLTDLLRQGVV